MDIVSDKIKMPVGASGTVELPNGVGNGTVGAIGQQTGQSGVPNDRNGSQGDSRKSSVTGDKKEREEEEDDEEDGTFKYESIPWYRIFVYDLVLWFLSVTFDCFFREITSRGAFRVPRNDPVIFVAAPHANQFVDPIILMRSVRREIGRRISFLIAEKSYRHPVIGRLSKLQLAIPVSRAQDNLVKATGKIYIDFDESPLVVKGQGTKFTTECMVKGLIALPQSLGASEILEIRSDTELVLRKEFKSSQKIKTLLTKGTNFKRADKINQKKVYQTVFQHLSHDNTIGIFPEGGSHDRTDLLPLKAGVAVMALGAMDNDPNCNVKIVPCGMNYFNAHKFRSRAVIEFGVPIEIPRELVKKYSNPNTNRESVKELLDIITTGLKAVTVTCEDYETLMVVQAARRLYAKNFAHYLPLPLVVEMNRRLVIGYQTFKDKEEVQKLKQKILTYNQKLKQLYLPDHDVEYCDESNKLRVLPVFIYRMTKLILLALLSLPGATLFSPVFLCAKIVSREKAKTALANSTVKIKANDVVATWKILISLGFAPLLYSFYASIGTWLCNEYQIFDISLISVWISLYLLGVAVTYAALITGEQGLDIFKSMRPLYLSITSGSSVKELKKFRDELSEEITSIVNIYGPQLFPTDFNLLKLQEDLKISDSVDYIDSDEEEERKTQELRNRRSERRKAARKAAKKAAKEAALEKANEESTEEPANDSSSRLSLEDKHSSSVSDGISLMNSDNSLTNIPIFSDYQLHKNANSSSSNSRMDFHSGFSSSMSMGDDYNVRSISHSPSVSRSDSSEHIELNFSGPKKLGDKIKQKIREGREKKSKK